jgi:predicted membrane-bound spermidine synthase
MSAAAKATRVLILGGDGLALREVLKYPGVTHVTLSISIRR